VADSSESHGPIIIVDPTFKDQFAITRPTPRYTAVLEALPAVFVCRIDQVRPVVELLCAEMSLAFHSTGIVLPPWRYAKSMLSKWLPRRGSLDVNVKLATAGGVGVAVPVMKAAVAQHASVAGGATGAVPAAAGVNNRSTRGRGTTLSGCDQASNVSAGSRVFSVTCYPATSSSSSGCSTSNDAHQDTVQVPDAMPIQTSVVGRTRSGLLPDSCGSGLKQHSFEPMQRVVGGFGVSAATAFHQV
jgi:hypothetical protein